MKTVYIVIGFVALYLYSKGQLGSSVQATFPIATTLLQDVTGSPPAPNQKNIVGVNGNGMPLCSKYYPGYAPGAQVDFGSTEGSPQPSCIQPMAPGPAMFKVAGLVGS